MRGLRLIVAVALATSLCVTAGVASAAPVQRVGTLVGIPREDPADTIDYYLESGTTLRRLDLPRPPRVRPSARIRVAGTAKANGRIDVTSIERLALARAAAVTGLRSVLIILVTAADPGPLRPAEAAAQMNGPTSDWLSEVSDGRVRLSATATPWLTVPEIVCEDISGLGETAITAAQALGFEPDAYDHVAVLFPSSPACGWTARSQTLGRLSWFNGRFDTAATVHELGHNFGLNHSAAAHCRRDDRTWIVHVSPIQSCSLVERGDPFDAMGVLGGLGHFNAAHKKALGWLEGRIADIGPGETATLTPYVSGFGLRAAAVKAGEGEFVFEYRRAEGFDSFLTRWPGATRGVLVHAMPDGPNTWTYLLDGQPDGDISSPALHAGQTVWLPGVQVRVDSVSPSQARLSVLGPEQLPHVLGTDPTEDGPPAPITTNIKATFSRPMDRASVEAGFRLLQARDQSLITGSFTWSGQTMTFAPDAELIPGDLYEVTIGGGRAVDGEDLIPYSWVFVTEVPANLVANPSFETDTSGWGSYQGRLRRVALSGAPHGDHVARAELASGTYYSVGDSEDGFRPTVGSTVAGTTYVAVGYARAASASAVGKPVKIVLRERNAANVTVREISTTATLGSRFTRLAVAADAASTGHTLGMRIEQTRAVAGDAMYADDLSLIRGFTVMGGTPVGSLWTNMSPDVKRVSPMHLTVFETVHVAKLRAYVDGRAATSGSQSVRGLVYANVAGGHGPAALLGQSREVTIAAGRGAGWVDFTIAPPLRLTPGTYWLGLHSGPRVVARYAATATESALRFNGDSYANGPAATFGTASTDAKAMSMYAVGG